MLDKLTKAFENFKGEEKRTDKIALQYPLRIPRKDDSIYIYEVRKFKTGFAVVAGIDDGDKAPMPISILKENELAAIIKHLESKA